MQNPYADRLNALPKSVASRTLTDATWNATVIDGDVVEAVAELKEADRDVLKFGTGLVDTVQFASGIVVHVLRPGS